MKKWKMMVIVAVMICMSMSNQAEASEVDSNKISIPILETVWVDENVQQGSRMGVPQSSCKFRVS